MARTNYDIFPELATTLFYFIEKLYDALVEQGVCPRGQDVEVELLGGTLTIRIGADGAIRMTGPAKTVYEATAQV